MKNEHSTWSARRCQDTVRDMFHQPVAKYAFFETGLEMAATRRHVTETAQKYGVEIGQYRPLRKEAENA